MEKVRCFIRRAAPRVIAGLALLMLGAATARAEITAYKDDTWSISFDGRRNAYYSFEWGDAYPHWTAAQIASFNGNPPTVNSIIWRDSRPCPTRIPHVHERRHRQREPLHVHHLARSHRLRRQRLRLHGQEEDLRRP